MKGEVSDRKEERLKESRGNELKRGSHKRVNERWNVGSKKGGNN